MNTQSLALLLTLGLLFPGRAIANDESGAWIDLLKQVDPQKHAVAGHWQSRQDGLSTDAVAGSRLTLPYQPTAEYDFRVRFTRISGVHSIALMFVAIGGQASFEVDAWGQHLAGLQMIDGRTLQDNPTRTEGQTLENGRKYTALVQVRKDRVRAFLDDKLIAEYATGGAELQLPDVWRMPDSRSLGIGAYAAATRFHSVEVRPASGAQLLAAAVPSAPRSAKPSPKESAPTGTPAPNMRKKVRGSNGSSKRVLLVIANQDFFYREYFDPRQELERAGITVEVAAGRKEACRPHANSGQQGSGHVMPDLTVADADATRYDAIMFSGGWGSSMYQYAFEGSYGNRAYNGDKRTKAAVNKLLNDFVKQDKYVGALCHGVSVLAWARVDGKSILAGRRAVGSPRQSPAGVYNGQRGQPLSRWNAEVNGARLTPARSMGNPSTSADDVMVDGKIITGEDDNTARLFGTTLAELLTSPSD